VLDAGCGDGWGTAALAEIGATAVGVDFAPAAIAEARGEHGDKASFAEADLRDLPFEDGEFDHVVCFETIAQIAEPEQALDELHRVLHPGGLLLISSPNRSAYPPGNPLHLSEMTSEEFERLLRARFANVAVHRQQSYHATLLGTPELLAHDDPDAQVQAVVSKVVGGQPGSELHAVAVASAGELPPAPAELVLGELVDYNEQQAHLEEWRERAVQAEATALAHSRKLRALQP
jgi:SAM-dependent methyltransferase